MNHYTDEAWLDYARGLLPAERLHLMRSHLEAGCAHCAGILSLWENAHQTAGRLWQDEPEADAVRIVKAAFSQIRRPTQEPHFLGVARLLFDSFVTASATGVRSISSTARHLLYQVEGVTIDLRLDSNGGTELVISGQVLDAAAAGSSGVSADVILTRGELELSRTSTNEFGEFQLAGADGVELSIRVLPPDQKPITLKLPE